MIKQFTIPCKFDNIEAPVTFYIGHPESAHHPIHFQSDWISKARGGFVPEDFMNTLQKLHDLSITNNVDFEDLCYYAMLSASNHNKSDTGSVTKFAEEFIHKETNQSSNVYNNDNENVNHENNKNVKDFTENIINVKNTQTNNAQSVNNNFDDDLFGDTYTTSIKENDNQESEVNNNLNDNNTYNSEDEDLL